MVKRREDLSTPRGSARLGVHYDPEAFGQFSEAIARFLGTARFLVVQTVVVVVWITINIFAVGLRWDPYPFILLNLAFSTQAAYAAPLILLAQNRQEARERTVTERDRRIGERTQQDAEYLAREVAGVRMSLDGVVTTNDLETQLEPLADTLARLSARLDELAARLPAVAAQPDSTEPAG